MNQIIISPEKFSFLTFAWTECRATMWSHFHTVAVVTTLKIFLVLVSTIHISLIYYNYPYIDTCP